MVYGYACGLVCEYSAPTVAAENSAGSSHFLIHFQ